MSTQITLEFFSADEKPEESCHVLAVFEANNILPRRSVYEIPYSKKHDVFNALDCVSREEAEKHAITNVVAWAHVPDWGSITE